MLKLLLILISTISVGLSQIAPSYQPYSLIHPEIELLHTFRFGFLPCTLCVEHSTESARRVFSCVNLGWTSAKVAIIELISPVAR